MTSKNNSHIVKANVKHNWSEYQKAIFRNIAKDEGHCIIEARAGSAKCLGKGTKVLLYNGSSKNVEDILVGDKLMGPDSKPRKVLSINSGFGDLVKVIPTKGDSWVCNTDHILTLIESNSKDRKIIDVSVKDYCNRYGHYKDLSKKWKLFKTKIDFPNQHIPYDPYFIGLWIGDGTKAEVTITNMDPEVIDYCKLFAFKHDYLLRITPEKSKCYRLRFAIGGRGVGHKGTPHLLKRYLLNNCVKNNKKIIPLEYIINSEENRLKLLAGLIDTDGTYARGNFIITSSNKDLAEQYLFLARSLGFASYIKEEVSKIKKLKFYGKCWRVSIIGNCEIIPTKIARKRANKRLQIKNPLVNGFDILPIGKGDFYGFILNKDGRFLLGDFTVTHNTTSIIESFKYIPKGKSTLVLAFNKIIQQELKERSPSYIKDILTFHSLGFRSIKQRFPGVELDDYKIINILSDQLDKRSNHDLIANVADTVAYCKYSLSDTPRQIDQIIDECGIDTCDLDRQKFISLVVNTLSRDKADTSKIDFNDMCWFPYVYNMSVGQYDYVYVDEAHDINRSNLVMAQRACKPVTGRIIICRDKLQQIYGWRKADNELIDKLQELPKTKTLLLPISYRCPKKVIELAKNWAEDITCPETAIEGNVEDISLNQLYTKAKPGCFILSRTNAPLIKICMNFIRKNIKANILGRDVGKQISYLVKKSKKKQIPAFLNWLEKWKDEEVLKLTEKNINTDNVLDRYECLVNLCDECKSLDEVTDKANELFNDTDQNNIVILSTAHRSKGKETKDVFILRWTYRVWLDNCSVMEKPNEECNIAYVSCTRAKENLYIVNKWGAQSD